MGRSRRCCCCQDIWTIGARFEVKSPSDYTQNAIISTGGYVTNQFSIGGGYDQLHRRYFLLGHASGGGSVRIGSYDEETKANADVLVKNLAGVDASKDSLGVAKQLELLCYTHLNTDPTPGIDVYTVNYDGTGDALIVTIPQITSPAGYGLWQLQGRPMWSKTTGLFYLGLAHGGSLSDKTTLRIYSFHTDGSGLTSIYENVFTGNPAVGDICITDVDNLNGRLWFRESTYDIGGSTQRRTMKCCDLDGSNVQTFYDFPLDGTQPWNIICAQVSYHDQCLYVSQSKGSAASDLFGGIYKRDFNFNQLKKIAGRSDTVNPTNFDLACGFDRVGPTYKG